MHLKNNLSKTEILYQIFIHVLVYPSKLFSRQLFWMLNVLKKTKNFKQYFFNSNEDCFNDLINQFIN